MQSCVGTDEYGCPYTTYKTNGTVKDENGNKVQGAEVSVKADVIVEKENIYGEKFKDTISQPIQTVYSNKKGVYEVSHGDLLDELQIQTCRRLGNRRHPRNRHYSKEKVKDGRKKDFYP